MAQAVKCSVQECEKLAYRKGLCYLHRARMYRTGRLDLVGKPKTRTITYSFTRILASDAEIFKYIEECERKLRGEYNGPN